MNVTDKRKQSLYFPREMLAEICAEARRQDRSLSWIVQQAWKIARERFKERPSTAADQPQMTGDIAAFALDDKDRPE